MRMNLEEQKTLEEINQKLERIDKKLDKLEEHIDFIESVYKELRNPIRINLIKQRLVIGMELTYFNFVEQYTILRTNYN